MFSIFFFFNNTIFRRFFNTQMLTIHSIHIQCDQVSRKRRIKHTSDKKELSCSINKKNEDIKLQKKPEKFSDNSLHGTQVRILPSQSNIEDSEKRVAAETLLLLANSSRVKNNIEQQPKKGPVSNCIEVSSPIASFRFDNASSSYQNPQRQPRNKTSSCEDKEQSSSSTSDRSLDYQELYFTLNNKHKREASVGLAGLILSEPEIFTNESNGITYNEQLSDVNKSSIKTNIGHVQVNNNKKRAGQAENNDFITSKRKKTEAEKKDSLSEISQKVLLNKRYTEAPDTQNLFTKHKSETHASGAATRHVTDQNSNTNTQSDTSVLCNTDSFSGGTLAVPTSGSNPPLLSLLVNPIQFFTKNNSSKIKHVFRPDPGDDSEISLCRWPQRDYYIRYVFDNTTSEFIKGFKKAVIKSNFLLNFRTLTPYFSINSDVKVELTFKSIPAFFFPIGNDYIDNIKQDSVVLRQKDNSFLHDVKITLVIKDIKASYKITDIVPKLTLNPEEPLGFSYKKNYFTRIMCIKFSHQTSVNMNSENTKCSDSKEINQEHIKKVRGKSQKAVAKTLHRILREDSYKNIRNSNDTPGYIKEIYDKLYNLMTSLNKVKRENFDIGEMKRVIVNIHKSHAALIQDKEKLTISDPENETHKEIKAVYLSICKYVIKLSESIVEIYNFYMSSDDDDELTCLK
ncbi:hypothetical protein CDIK_1381 [Cucumispora dikerogammari]|nr:hypothetical protein CDIK_1381 [Cucumispora dikerogammari]